MPLGTFPAGQKSLYSQAERIQRLETSEVFT